MNHFRVRKFDSMNYVIEELILGQINPFTGKPGKDHWSIVGYYGKLSDLAVYLLNRQIEVPAGTLAEQIPALIEAIKTAEVRIAETLTVAMEA